VPPVVWEGLARGVSGAASSWCSSCAPRPHWIHPPETQDHRGLEGRGRWCAGCMGLLRGETRDLLRPLVESPRCVWATLFLVQLSYCVWHVLAKKALLQGFSPLVLALYRELLACLLLHGMAFVFDGGLPWARLSRRDLITMAYLGIFSYGNVVGFIVALDYITAFNSSLLHPSIPVFAAAFGWAMGVESLSGRAWAGVTVCAIGAVVVIVWGVREDPTPTSNDDGEDDDSGSGSGGVVLGNIILLVQCVSLALLLVFEKPVLERLPPISVTACYYSFAAVYTAVTTLAAVPPSAEEYLIETRAEWVALVYGSTVSVAFIYTALSWATKRTSPSTVAVSMTLQPPLNAALSVLFLGRTIFTTGEVLGGVLIVIGLLVTVRYQAQGEEEGGLTKETRLMNSSATNSWRSKGGEDEIHRWGALPNEVLSGEDEGEESGEQRCTSNDILLVEQRFEVGADQGGGGASQGLVVIESKREENEDSEVGDWRRKR